VEIKTEVAGTVWKIEVAVGAKVAAGDTLLILESMKMEIPIDAPRDGTVRELHVAEQEVIKDGQVLLILG
jgi:acetyl-CoA carboxylase biotin carboxyl carrier protein